MRKIIFMTKGFELGCNNSREEIDRTYQSKAFLLQFWMTTPTLHARSMGAWLAAEIPSDTTRCVSSGSITVSTQRRAAA